jgi:hypothetical protein
VRVAGAAGGLPHSHVNRAAPVFVRRRGRELPPDLQWRGARCADVDWCSSLLLNLVVQTAYSLSVVQCKPHHLPGLARLSSEGERGKGAEGDTNSGSGRAGSGMRHGPPSSSDTSSSNTNSGSGRGVGVGVGSGNRGNPSSGSTGGKDAADGGSMGNSMGNRMYRVRKEVFASPYHVPVNLDSSKTQTASPAPCYPDVSFAVDNFQDAFESMVLHEADDCFCVLLHADVGGSWGAGGPGAARGVAGGGQRGGGGTAEAAGAGLGVSSGASVGGPQHSVPTEVLVFSGFVSCDHLASAVRGSGADQLQALFGGGALATSQVLMRGPGGVGAADVAVTKLAATKAAAREVGGKELPLLLKNVSRVLGKGGLVCMRVYGRGRGGGIG